MKGRFHIPRVLLISLVLMVTAISVQAQGGDKALQMEADALFEKGEYAKAYPMYSQLVSLSPQDHELNYKYGACTLYSGQDKSKAVGYLKFAVGGPATSNLAWYFLGRAYQLDYQFDEAVSAYQHYRGTADKKLMTRFPVDAMEQQCRNGKYLLSNLKDIQVLNKVEVDAADFFRFYDLSDIGGKIVVTPVELRSSIDRKSGEAFLTYLPTNGGAIYFSSYGKDGRSGRDIYRSELLPTGGYAIPVKLAGYINTDQDEDYAVMAPDGRSFYFCSKGHNSMGGYDVFRSTYDKGMDVFGAPENMDFAVNTPADELLYIVGPDGKQACFASDRDSKQGMVNVYRVGTTQTPINITVLKGIYASDFDPSDRRARIIVEDDITRERVAEVTTDANGEYVLALPRGGKYKVLVEGGPSGRSHLTTMDVPSAHKPMAFKQELKLVEQGGEQVNVKNHFDKPLDEDVMALALDEIRRRAKLNVTGETVIAQVIPPVSSTEDPLQLAGFDGSMTMEKAMGLATNEAETLAALAAQQEENANTAYTLALQNVEVAERESKQAASLLKQANAAADEADKKSLMQEAAEAKQLSSEAGARARAAYQTGSEIGEAGALNKKRAKGAEALSAELAQAQASKDQARSTTALKQLKADIDGQKGPNAHVDEVERMRREASGSGTEASRRMRQATALREDETILVDRVGRLGREVEAANGRKKEELSAQLATLEHQRNALHEEVEKAFAQAHDAEDAAALARGQVQLLRYLENTADGRAAERVNMESLAGLDQRLAQVREGNMALVIDPQYDPIAAVSAEERERRTFNWGTDGALAGTTNSSKTDGTRTQARSTSSGSATSDPSGTGLVSGDLAQDSGTLQQETLSSLGTSDQARTQNQSGTSGSQGNKSNTVSEQNQGDSTVLIAGAPDSEQQQNVPDTGSVKPADEEVQLAENEGSVNSGSIAQEGSRSVGSEGTGQVGDSVGLAPQIVVQGELTPSGQNSTAIGAEAKQSELGGGATGSERSSQVASTTEQGGQRTAVTAGGGSKQQVVVPTEETGFLMANKLAELEQLRQGEKDRIRKDSLDQAIVEQKSLIKAYNAEERTTQTIDKQRSMQSIYEYTLLEFDMSIMDEELAEEAYPGFNLRRKTILDGPGTAHEKASMLHALEMQLLDSIDVQTAKALTFLEQNPEKAEEMLPRLERWRKLKATHAESAVAALAEVDQEYAATETKEMEDAQLAAQAQGQKPAEASSAPDTPHNDSYISITDDLDQIYASPLTPRSAKNADAVALKDRDLQIGVELKMEIDSMQIELSEMPAGKNYDKQRQKVDRKVDDLLIHNVDLGQRLAFISSSEYAVAKDSAKVLSKNLSKRGLAPDEPLMQMGRSYVEAGDAAMAKGKNFRKQADDSRDIFKRNSLYRQAYAEELKGLRDYDRSHTVRNYLLSGQAAPGETLTYEEVEERMYPAAFARTDRSDAGSTPKAQQGQDGISRTNQEQVSTIAPIPTERDSATDSSGVVVGGVQGGVVVVAQPGREEAGQGTALTSVSAERADSTVLSEYLGKYYYLNAQERSSVMNGEEERNYFMMKGRSLQERAEAAAMQNEAEGAEALAEVLRSEAGVLQDSNEEESGNKEQVQKLQTRASALQLRSDSLHREAELLIRSSTVNDTQAATLMQGMPADRSAAIMDLEQGKRRTEPLLARTRPRPSSPSATTTQVDQQQVQLGNTEIQATQPPLVEVNRQEETDLLVEGAKPAVQQVDAQERIASNVADSAEQRTAASESVKVDESLVNVEVAEEAQAVREGAPERLVGRRTNMDRVSVPFDKPLARDVFEFEKRDTPREEAIPIDAPMPVGVVYKVQVGAFRNELPLEAFSDMTPVAGEHAGNGLVRYTAGMFTSAESASEAGKKVRDRGYRDAFVVAYMDGKRVPLRDAMQAERAQLGQNAALSATAGAPVASAPGSTPASTSSSAGSTASSSGTTVVVTPVTTTAPPTTTIPQAAPGAAVLAEYPATTEEVLAAFKPSERATAYYNDPTAAPAKQVEAVKGLFFTVQVGVYSKPTALDRLFNISPLNSELTANEKIRYTTGIFLDEGTAVKRKDGTVALGVTDAFITAYLNGKRIPIRDARALLAKFGRDVLVDPGLATP